MRYWDEMRSKYGFGDGGAVPPDAETAREIYVRTLNALAEARGRKVRALAYDRPGAHNWCLIVFHLLDDLSSASVKPAEYHLPVHYGALVNIEEAAPDDGLHEAIEQAMHEMVLDDYVLVEVSIHPNFESEVLQTIKRKDDQP